MSDDKKPFVLLFQVNIMAKDRESAFEEATLLTHELTRIRGFLKPVLIYGVQEGVAEVGNYLEFMGEAERIGL